MSPLIVRVALAALVALATGTGAAVAQSKLATVTVIASPDDAITPVLYAKASGMFERAGLDVQIAKGSGGAAVTAAVVGGSYDIGHGRNIQSVNDHTKIARTSPSPPSIATRRIARTPS